MFTAENPALRVEPAQWVADREAIAAVRRRVFIDEQGVPEALEWEVADPFCEWFVARHDGGVVGIARLTPDRRIGRMAVLPAWRGKGVGTALLQAVLQRAGQLGLATVSLHAQIHAMAFYARFGFRPEGDEFMEAGIPHRAMSLDLKERT